MASSNAKNEKPQKEDKRTQKLKEMQKTPTKKKKMALKKSSGTSTGKATKTAKTPEEETTTKNKTPSKQTPRRDNEHKKTKAVANGKVSETEDVVALSSSSESEAQANAGTVKNQKGKSLKAEKRKRGEEEEEESGDDGEEKGEEKMCRFPMNRIKRIIKIENSDASITQEAIFIVNKAMEKFLEKFAEDGYKYCIKDKKKSLSYNHLSSVVSKQRQYEFLSDFVPVKVKAEDALKESKVTDMR